MNDGTLNETEAAKLVGVSKRQMLNLRKMGMPFTKVGKRGVRYVADQLKAWLLAGGVRLEAQGGGNG